MRYPAASKLGLTLWALATPAFGQAQSVSGVDAEATIVEIVVTAQKRSKPLRTTAASVQAVAGGSLEAHAMRSLQDLARLVPSMSIAPETGIGDRNIVLRGIAPSGGTQPTVVTYLDDILIPNSIDPQLYDLERVEILKGPQGDLYGASAAGGLIRYVEARPDPAAIGSRFEASGSATEGGAANSGLAAVVNLPLADAAAIRLSGVYDRRGGYVDNIDPVTGARHKETNDLERFTGRAAAAWVPSETVELRASALYNSRVNGALDESDLNDRLPDGAPSTLRTSRFFPESGSDKASIYNVTVDIDVAAGTITSATGFVDQRIDRLLDLRDIYHLDPDLIGFAYPGFDPSVNGDFVSNPNTAMLSPFVRQSRFRQFTQEIRFNSAWGFPVQVLAGAFYLDSDTDSFQRLGFDAPIPEFSVGLYGADPDTLVEAGFTGKESVEELAGFANLRWEFADGKGEITGGIRVYDRKNPRRIVDTPGALFPNSIDATARDDGTLYSASASYEFTPTLFGYGRFATGFRPGVGRILPGPICDPDFATLGIDRATIPPFTKPEKLDSFEAGVRASSRDDRFSASIVGFVIEYQDIQQSLVLPTCASIFDVNAGQATSKGVELEARLAPRRDLGFVLAIGYTDSRLDEADPFSGGDAGEQLQFVPEWTFSIQQDYRRHIGESLELILRSDLTYIDRRQTEFGQTGSRPEAETALAAHTLVNAQVGVARDSWEVVLFAENLTDELAIYGTNQARYFGTLGRTWSIGTPRTFGVRAQVEF